MAGKAAKKGRGRQRKLYTLTEVSKKTNISMPTLQRYKKLYQSRIPSVGEGRTQRYPEKALKVFGELKKENVARRGRPRKSGAKVATRGRRRAGSGGKSENGGLLTLSEIGRRTGISYPTLLRYVRLHLNEIPHRGSGRTRRYPVEAVEVFARLRAQSRRGRKPAAASGPRQGVVVNRALESRLQRLEAAHTELAKELRGVIKSLRKPLQVTIRTR